MRDTEAATIESSIKECNNHMAKCMRARKLLASLFPLTVEKFENLSEDQVEHLDQLIYRFTKMQDSMGRRLLPSLYAYVEADDSPKPFLTIIARLEQLSILTSAEDWQFFRNLRNNLAHDYPESIGQTVDTLNTLDTEFESFATMYEKIREYWRSLQKDQ
ncbi:MAG: hypothetical protein DRP87_19480 [Spirochaetes bacterium]|nr:MAG: hypothetical protein DRP87_19480 [Spirochaetota bacterium]